MKAQIEETSKSSTKPRILVIEDQEDMRNLLRAVLARNGFEVEVAETGFKGLQAAHEKQFDLILSDIDLPDEINGLEICRELRADSKTLHIPIIVMSGRLARENYVQAFKMGATDYISKPFSVSEILQKVSRHVIKAKPAT